MTGKLNKLNKGTVWLLLNMMPTDSDRGRLLVRMQTDNSHWRSEMIHQYWINTTLKSELRRVEVTAPLGSANTATCTAMHSFRTQHKYESWQKKLQGLADRTLPPPLVSATHSNNIRLFRNARKWTLSSNKNLTSTRTFIWVTPHVLSRRGSLLSLVLNWPLVTAKGFVKTTLEKNGVTLSCLGTKATTLQKDVRNRVQQ